MADAVIQNVRKDSAGEITAVGVRNRSDWSVAKTVSSIEDGSNTFFVRCPSRADVHVARTAVGRKFLKTTADTTTRNNLDSLPPLSAPRRRPAAAEAAAERRVGRPARTG